MSSNRVSATPLIPTSVAESNRPLLLVSLKTRFPSVIGTKLAKLAVKDAIDAQQEATESQTESQSKLNEVVNGAIVGSVIYDSLLQDLNDAKDAQAEASENVTEAIKRETEAYKDLADAIRAAALAAGASGQTFTAPTLPTVPAPTNTGATLTGGRTEQGTPTIVINTGIGTNGIEAGRQIVEVLQQYSRIAGGNFLEFAVA